MIALTRACAMYKVEQKELASAVFTGYDTITLAIPPASEVDNMSKKDKAKTTETPAPVAPQIMRVKEGLKFRGARESWYNLLLQHNGQDAGSFIEAAKANPPCLTKKGTAEDPRGWLRFFVRNEVVSY